MRFKIVLLLLLLVSVGAHGAIGWCGQIWPNSRTNQPVDTAIDVYFQMWKDGVTDPSGRGDSIAATLYWKDVSDPSWTTVTMTYLGDVGNNDEYNGQIPAFSSPTNVLYYCEALDSTDMTTATGQDQNLVDLNETTPGTLFVVNTTTIDVTVTFQVDMTLETVTGAVTVASSFNGWDAAADTMTDPDMDDIYTIDVLFPSGTSPNQEYKFVNGGVWESISNRSFLVDDSSPAQVLPVDYFNDNDPADYTTTDVTVNFSVDMSSETVIYPYVAGNVYPLVWGWDAGWSDTLGLYDDGSHGDGSSGDGIYGALITFPSGSYRYVEYKYTTDGTDNEPLPPFVNHEFTLGDSALQVLPTDTFGVLAGVDEKRLPDKLQVEIAPNPFNSEVGINIIMPSEGELMARIYDMGGRQASTLYDGLSGSKIDLTWDASDYPSGVYLLRVEASGQTRVSKLLLVR